MLISQRPEAKWVIALLAAWIFGLFLLTFLPLALDRPVFLAAFAGAAVLTALFLFHPEICFLILLMTRAGLDPVLNLTKLPVGGSAMGFGAVLNLLLILIAVGFFVRRPEILRKIPLKKSWVLFLVTAIAAVCYAPVKEDAAKLLGNFFSYAAVFVLPFFLIKNTKDSAFWIRMLAASFVLPVVITNLDFFTGGMATADAGSRFRGPFSHSNILAFYLVLGLSVLFYLFKRNIFRPRGWACAAVVLLVADVLVQLFATKTRNAWLSLWAMMLLYGVLKDRKFVWVALLAVPLSLCVPTVQQRVLEIFTGTHHTLEEGMNSWEWRVAVWQSSWASIQRSPIWGSGLGSFMTLSKTFFEGGKEVGAHNTYLQILFEGGVVGLLSFLSVLFGLVGKVWTDSRRFRSPEYSVALVYVIGYAVTCFADNLIYYLVLNWYFLFFIGLVMRQAQLEAECPRGLKL